MAADDVNPALRDRLELLIDDYGPREVATVLLEMWHALHPEASETSDGGNPTPVLEEAQAIIQGARQAAYGSPAESLGRIAALWSAYLDAELSGQDVALMMVLLKASRARNGILADGGPQRDSLVDIAGYAGCAELC